jgi:hypothetical protein
MAGHSTKAKGVDRRKNPYRTFFRDNISDEDLKLIWEKTIEDAKDGNDKARKEVFDRLFGRPDQNVNAHVDELKKILPPWMTNESQS